MKLVIKNNSSVIDILMSELFSFLPDFPKTLTESIKIHYPNNVYLILIGCLLSLRARDVVTWPVANQFFKTVTQPDHMASLSISEIETAIQSINFYRTKARVLHQVSIDLIAKHAGKVPATVEELLSLPGVGIKTANLVLAEGFGIPAICVDTHVHRLSNRWGLVNTRTAEQTEKQLRLVLPQKYWIDWNRLLVVIGQNICTARCKGCRICTYFDSSDNS